jgi:hypothetical protein
MGNDSFQKLAYLRRLRHRGLNEMLSVAYAMARWLEYVSGALALIALAAVSGRLVKRPRKQILGPTSMLVTAGAICVGMFLFLGTRVVQVRLDSIRQLGLETHHAGLRTDALIFDTQVSVPVALRPLPPGTPLSSVIDKISAYLVNTTTTVRPKVAVYGLIDFATVEATSATVNRQARIIVLSLPNPTISKDTTYIVSVNGIQVREGPLNAVAQSLTGLFDSLFHRPVMSFSAQPALAKAKADALIRAQHSRVLDSCGKEEIARQLADLFHLTPQYQGYTVKVIWPMPPAVGVNCAALQGQLARNGS